LHPKKNHMDVKVLILGIIAVEDITVVITMEITTEAETVVVEEIPDAAVAATEAAEEEIPDAAAVVATEAAAEEEIPDAAAAVATVAVETVEEILVVAAVAVATVAVEMEEEIQVVAAAEEEIPDAAVVATEAAAEEEIPDAAAAVATVAVETVEEILVVAAVAEEILDVAAVETAAEIPTMEDTVVVTEMCTKVVTVEEIPAVAETEVETKITAPIPIKVIERLNRIIERQLLQNRIILVPTRTQKVVTIVESQEVELTLLHILKRRDSWVEEGHSHVNNYATGQNIHVKVVVVEELLVSVTSMHKKMIESISL
jgi:hypothetical protein